MTIIAQQKTGLNRSFLAGIQPNQVGGPLRTKSIGISGKLQAFTFQAILRAILAS